MPRDPMQKKIGQTIAFMSDAMLWHIIIPAMEGRETTSAERLTDMTMDFLRNKLNVVEPLEIMFITGAAMSVIQSLTKNKAELAHTN